MNGRGLDQFSKSPRIEQLLNRLRGRLCWWGRDGRWRWLCCCWWRERRVVLGDGCRQWTCKCRHLLSDHFQLIWGKLLLGQNALKIKQGLEPLLGGGIERIVGKVHPGCSHQSFQVAVERLEIQIRARHWRCLG